MTRLKVVKEAENKGYRNVLTMAGVISLKEWAERKPDNQVKWKGEDRLVDATFAPIGSEYVYRGIWQLT